MQGVSPRLGLFKLDVQVDLTQDLGDLFTLWLVADIGHRLPIVMRRVGNLKGFTGAASCRLLDLGDHFVEGMMIIIEELPSMADRGPFRCPLQDVPASVSARKHLLCPLMTCVMVAGVPRKVK